ncbi:TorF family putative porin [Ideonella sp. A 288]|uniref:TorF family putative porin n=1 Tax=Ideonella sp. A 288 TaxID=1962181 RepID=UPI000B4A563B|nr:TorF family putative porin [Ideonella sp. A 288]
MKNSLIALSFVAAAAALPTASYADLAFNVGAVSDYRYRGISQTRLKPALQGGIDFTSGGLYIGAWASTIKWIDDARGDAKIEVDLYAGYKGEIVKDVGYDVGILNYWYPSAVTSGWSATPYTNPNTTELYGAVTYGPVTAKYSHGLTSLFGNPDSKNSYYLDLSATFDVAGFSVVPHVGYQKVKNTANASYTDYSITVSKDFNGIVPSLAIVGTDADKGFYVPGVNANSTKFLGKAALVLGVKYNF